MIHAWDQVSFSASESEEEEELPHEIPQELFRDRDLNRRLDYAMLPHVNRNFETLFDLSGQTLFIGKQKTSLLVYKVMWYRF